MSFCGCGDKYENRKSVKTGVQIRNGDGEEEERNPYNPKGTNCKVKIQEFHTPQPILSGYFLHVNKLKIIIHKIPVQCLYFLPV